MADGLRLRIDSSATRSALADLDRRANRATMWALREVGRRVRREARRPAPVYHGPPRTADVYGTQVDVEPGELKKAIRSSRRLKNYGKGEYGLTVGPRGDHVHLYANKQEALTPYMKTGYEAAVRDAVELHAKAWERAMRR